MPKLTRAKPERLADHFVNYLFDEYQGSIHVRRVASWVGFIVLGIERAAGSDWKIPRTRQLQFACGVKVFKAKYNHKAGKRGGIEIVEVLPDRGSPEGKVVAQICSLAEAEQFYNRAEAILLESSR
jgi:hypothetical protein